MPLKTQHSGPISGLKTYVPYSINNQVLVEDIIDMVSYDVIEPQEPVDLQFTFGASNSLIRTLKFKNLTKNAKIELSFDFDSTIFIAPTSITIEPEQTVNVDLRLNAGNMQPRTTEQPARFKVNVKNVKLSNSGPLTFKASGSAGEQFEFISMGKTITLYE